ncbi:coiled-coil domain-containing protein 157 isoform X2 [Melanotaenia boesemani]|uniref:coiled-coil domain-containing protein 157 isoform X2 n=1 Tax=Melanotaenia boesemani TaxID=1250792 RepID=UPI001C048B53|nr:coiled-coil domain-containing protein 157 isoform X2 [Melanotaenia boesemani]
MTELLGRQDCIKSLRKDLVDIQGAILDVFSRTGPVQFFSWKFPDKLSCDLDMLALLEEYDFVDGEDAFNQHSHIVLLELVIDSVSAYIGQQRGLHRREHTQQKGCLSVGLVVKTYWSNLFQFASRRETSKDMTKQKQTKAFDCNETKTMSPISSISNASCRHSSAWSSTNSFQFYPQMNESLMPNHKAPCYPKADRHNVSCQTIESSLTPCDACHQAQSLLRTTGKTCVDLLQNEGLPSSLQPLSDIMEATVELGHMTAGDVAQWANEQLKDMRRLAKHLQDVRGTVQPLKDKVTATEIERNRFRSQLEGARKEFKQEVEKHQANIVQLEFSLQKAQRSMKETERKLQVEQRELKREILSLEESNTKLKEEATLQQETIHTLECEKNMLQEKLQNLQTEAEACYRLQQRVQQLETQISDTQLLFDKENAKYQSACRQQESMQAKQKSLLERVDALDEENEELQRELGEREEAQISLRNQLQQMSEVKEQLQTQLTQQQDLCVEVQKEKQALETHADQLKTRVAELTEHVRALRERERLLVAFPELNNWPQAQPQSTGDMLLDMEQQMQANSVRMKVLEQENATLHKCLEKLKQKAHNSVTTEVLLQQAWSIPTEKQQSDLGQVQKSPIQSSSEAQVGYSNREKKVKEAESVLQSAKSEDHVPVLPLSLQIHPQTIHLDTGAADVKSCIRNTSLISRCKDFTQRKK